MGPFRSVFCAALLLAACNSPQIEREVTKASGFCTQKVCITTPANYSRSSSSHPEIITLNAWRDRVEVSLRQKTFSEENALTLLRNNMEAYAHHAPQAGDIVATALSQRKSAVLQGPLGAFNTTFVTLRFPGGQAANMFVAHATLDKNAVLILGWNRGGAEMQQNDLMPMAREVVAGLRLK